MSPLQPAGRRQDSQQLIRQWTLLRLLSSANRAWGVKELSEQMRVTKSTIERDLATLQQTFVVREESAGKQKRLYRIDESIRALESISFGTTELLAIYAAHAALGGLSGTPLQADLRSVIDKLRGFLSPAHNGGLNALVKVYATHARGGVDYGAQGDVIDDLGDCIARTLRCTLTYASPWAGTTRTHEARPLRLVWHGSALYVLACLGKHERITTLAVQRIRALEKSTVTFPPPKLDVDGHIARAFGIFVSDQEEDVEVIFDKATAWRVEERVFHPAEKKERRPDGSLRWRLRSSAQWEILPWVQSFGAGAELVAPASWRAALRASIEAMMATYREP